jgi:hypothetical protein
VLGRGAGVKPLRGGGGGGGGGGGEREGGGGGEGGGGMRGGCAPTPPYQTRTRRAIRVGYSSR